MTCAQAKSSRRYARIDPRYAKQGRKDVSARDARFRAQIQRQKEMIARKGASKK
jgi:hypothetical protein